MEFKLRQLHLERTKLLDTIEELKRRVVQIEGDLKYRPITGHDYVCGKGWQPIFGPLPPWQRIRSPEGE